MNRRCCVKGCGKRQASFKFPTDETMLFKWCMAIRGQDDSGIPWKQRSSLSRVCIDHFLPTNFVEPVVDGKLVLKAKAVPSIFPGRSTEDACPQGLSNDTNHPDATTTRCSTTSTQSSNDVNSSYCPLILDEYPDNSPSSGQNESCQSKRLKKDDSEVDSKYSCPASDSCSQHPSSVLVEDFSTGERLCSMCGSVVTKSKQGSPSADSRELVPQTEVHRSSTTTSVVYNYSPVKTCRKSRKYQKDQQQQSELQKQSNTNDKVLPTESALELNIKKEPEETAETAELTSGGQMPLATNVKKEVDELCMFDAPVMKCDVVFNSPVSEAHEVSAKKPAMSRTMKQGLATLKSNAEVLNLSAKITKNAGALFKKVSTTKLLQGRPVNITVSTCLYISCRQEGVPRTFREIADITKVSKKDLGRCFKVILRALDTSVDVITTADFMCRFCHLLGLGSELMEAAQHIATESSKLNLVSGRSPVSVAAAAIFLASQASSVPRSAAEIAAASGVSEATIHIVYRSIYPHARELFPARFNFHNSIETLPSTRAHLLSSWTHPDYPLTADFSV